MCWWLLSSTNKQFIEKSRFKKAMIQSFILLCVICRVSLEMQAVQHFYMARKESNASPIQTGYVYDRINHQPSTILTFYNKGGREKQLGDKEKRLGDVLSAIKTLDFSSEPNISENMNNKPLKPTLSEKIEKGEVKRYRPKRDVLLEKKPSNVVHSYKKNDYVRDEEDVRTDLSNSNDGWPLFYHSPYEYEPMNFDNEIEKAQDKRFIAAQEDKKVIPVHEHIKEDNKESQLYTAPYYTYTTDNPILADQPFFSYVLNDYFDKTDDDDPLTFKGLSWGKEFDQEMSFLDIDDYAKRIRRLEDDPPSHKKVYGAETEVDESSLQMNKRGNNHDSEQKFKENRKGNKNNQNSQSYNDYKGENNRGFRNFADYFANRFGTEDHNNILKHNVKNNVDRGEKKKGFRKVYHKDEYQEHTEFHDNNDKKDDYENRGESKIRIGGSEAFLNSQTAAAIGSDNNRIGQSENNEIRNFIKKNESGHQKRKDNNFSEYRDVAKNAAKSNNADYIDRFLK